MAVKSSHPIKIVTCCYCGARSTLSGKRAQRLVCHGCGAAIRRIETFQPALERRRKTHDHAKPATPHPAERAGQHLDKDRPARRKKGTRRRRSVWYYVSEAIDELDLDDIFDVFD